MASWDPDGRYRDRLSIAERVWCDNPLNKVTCAGGYLWAEWATEQVERVFGPDIDGTPRNAFKHCIWAGACTLGLGKGNAKGITDRHENWVNGKFIDQPRSYHPKASAWWRREKPKRLMDLHNNAVGIALASRIPYWEYHSSYHGYFMTAKAQRLISDACLKALFDGRLRFIKGSLREYRGLL